MDNTVPTGAQDGAEASPPGTAAILREFAGFVSRPRPIEPGGFREKGALKRLGVLAALQVAVLLLVLLPLLQLWQSAFALPAPDAFGQVPPELIVPVVVIAAPLLEEMLFRGWLTGRPRALWLLLCAIAFGALLAGSAAGLSPLAVGGGALALLLAAPLGWWLMRKRGAPGWYAGAFPVVYWLGVAIFAGSHAVNYPSFSWLALPLVLPQLWAALVLGFIRMRIGLVAAMLSHAFANGCTLALAMLAN